MKSFSRIFPGDFFEKVSDFGLSQGYITEGRFPHQVRQRQHKASERGRSGEQGRAAAVAAVGRFPRAAPVCRAPAPGAGLALNLVGLGSCTIGHYRNRGDKNSILL